jgi:DNA-binding GntR family transcriptional regulator
MSRSAIAADIVRSRVASSDLIPPRRRRRATVAEDVAAELREEIRSGVLRPGNPLRQNETAERLAVSVTPVREAFGILEREGLVRRVHQRGVVVFEPTVDDLAGCFDIRSALEALAAERAVEHLTDDDVAALRGILDEMAGTHGGSDSRYVELNAAFHARIESAARNSRLASLIDDQRAATNAYLMFLGGAPASFEDTEHEHEAILTALAARDPKAAAQAMSEHLQARKQAFLARLAPSS